MKIDIRKLDIAKARACMETRELAKTAGVAVGTLAQLRARRDGGGSRASAVTIGKLAKALGCDVEDILVDDTVN